MSENLSDYHSDVNDELQSAIEKKHIQFNEKGQAIGVGSAQFATYIGKVTRLHCPPAYSDWPHVLDEIKDTIWDAVFVKYDIDFVRRPYVLHKANLAWKNWKSALRKKYDEYPTDAECKKHVPKGMKKEDWEDFVDLTSTEEEKMKRVVGRTTREKMKMPHTSGRRGAARTEEELIKQSSDGKVPRTRVFLAIHTTNNPKVDDIRTLVENYPDLEEKDLDNDPVAMVCGPEWKGRVRAFGSGVSKTMIKASALYKEIAEQEKRKNEDLQLQVKVCRQRVDEETRARKRIEEKLESITNDLTNSNNASQGRRRSLSTSSGSSIPSSTRCLIKNFRKKAVALGNVCTEITPSEDSYSVRIDDIFDSTAELYVGVGTFEDISIGDTITWPRSSVEFI